MYNNNNGNNQSREITWLDYTIMKNPTGVMNILAKYGYIGYLAPQNQQELFEATVVLIEKNQDRAIIDLLRVHPDYEVIKDTPREGYRSESEYNTFRNFTNEEEKTVKKKKPDKTLMIVGGLIIAGFLISQNFVKQ